MKNTKAFNGLGKILSDRESSASTIFLVLGSAIACGMGNVFNIIERFNRVIGKIIMKINNFLKGNGIWPTPAAFDFIVNRRSNILWSDNIIFNLFC